MPSQLVDNRYMTKASAPAPNTPATAPVASGPAFSTLSLDPPTLANLTQLGYLSMTPIQAACLPAALSGQDLIAQAKTGSWPRCNA